jgi:hypothetical protein
MVNGLGILVRSIFKVDPAVVGAKIIWPTVVVYAQRMSRFNKLATNQIAYHPEPPYP